MNKLLHVLVVVIFFAVSSKTVLAQSAWGTAVKAVERIKDQKSFSSSPWFESTKTIQKILISEYAKNGQLTSNEIEALAKGFSGSDIHADWVWLQVCRVFFEDTGVHGTEEFHKASVQFRLAFLNELEKQPEKATAFYRLYARTGLFSLRYSLASPNGILATGLSRSVRNKYKPLASGPALTDYSKRCEIAYDAMLFFLACVAFEKTSEFPGLDRFLAKPSELSQCSSKLHSWVLENAYDITIEQDAKTFRRNFLRARLYLIMAATAALHESAESEFKKSFSSNLVGIVNKHRWWVWRNDDVEQSSFPLLDFDLLHLKIKQSEDQEQE